MEPLLAFAAGAVLGWVGQYLSARESTVALRETVRALLASRATLTTPWIDAALVPQPGENPAPRDETAELTARIRDRLQGMYAVAGHDVDDEALNAEAARFAASVGAP